MQTKNEAISAIRKLNTTVAPNFLAEFSKLELEQYLTRLRQRSNPQAAHIRRDRRRIAKKSFTTHFSAT